MPPVKPSYRSGIILVNLGTPASPSTSDVRRYLHVFLSDPRVIDLPTPVRWLLLYLCVLPFRPARSAAAYRKIWTDEGSPLLIHGRALRNALRTHYGPSVPVELAMRYGEPSISSAMERLQQAGVTHVVALPLFPHYSSASWGSAAEAIYTIAARQWNVPAVDIVPPFFDDPGYIESIIAAAAPVLTEPADRVLFSFHGLPESHILRGDTSNNRCLQHTNCCDHIGVENRQCYRAQCYSTARALAARLNLSEGHWEVSFQSRLGRQQWLRPYTDERVANAANEGVKRLLIFSPAFVADCLETLEEIDIGLREVFTSAGGEELLLAPCLNAHPTWVRSIAAMLDRHLHATPTSAGAS